MHGLGQSPKNNKQGGCKLQVQRMNDEAEAVSQVSDGPSAVWCSGDGLTLNSRCVFPYKAEPLDW